MKHISKLLALVLFASPLMADGLGQDVVSKTRETYSQGQYDDFLSQMEKDYQDSLRANHLEGLAALREAAHVQLSPEERQVLDKQFFGLKKERNRQLLAAIKGQEETEFVKKVRSLATELPEHNLIDFHIASPNSSNSQEVNRLIALDLELEYKLIHLDAPLAQGGSVDMRREKQLALKMQNADRMAGLGALLQDTDLKTRVTQYTDHSDEYLAREWDATDLHALGKGKIQPQNPLEEKVAGILASYQAQWSDLAKSKAAN